MFPDKALLAETFVEYRRGQWIVYIEVIFKDEIVKKEVGRYFTKKKAEIAANYIRRVANKELPFPPDGLGGCC
ncbi:MAG TPA: AP2 domain-containing protein [Aquificaceae bacterium]|nr:AP2 domain-containing protein [Aquificaceae bacterium]HIQ48165.1 AP2 domain-containing protein [Aquifex aeolicus]